MPSRGYPRGGKIINQMVVDTPKYKPGESVYHISPESDKGCVIDCRYNLAHKYWEYNVTFAPSVNEWYEEQELSKNKVFDL